MFVLKHTTSCYIYVWMYACICTLTLSYFCVSLVFDPSQTSLNRIFWFINRIVLVIELFTSLNSFVGAVKTHKLTGVPFCSS